MNELTYLDDEERTLMESLDKGEWLSDFNQSIKLEYQKYAKYSLDRQTRINIRMTERDLKRFTCKALK
jgi:predicted DNA binding CopG/RHH family protein